VGWLAEDVKDFLDNRLADGYSVATWKNNKHDLRVMQKAIGVNVKTQSLTASDMDKVFSTGALTLSPQALNNIQSTMAAFFRWCRDRDRVPPNFNPLAGRRYRKIPKKQRPRVPVGQFPQLLNAAVNPRDRMVIACGLYLMLRQSEIRDLRVGDVSLESGQIQCRIFKTKDLDLMPISSELDRELRTWLTLYTEKCGPLKSDWYLCPSRRFTIEDMGPKGIQPNRMGQLMPTKPTNDVAAVVKRALAGIGWSLRSSTGTAEHLGAHVLRRSAARAVFDELARDGYDGALRQVQSWLHHANSSMTEHYLGLEIDREVRNKRYSGGTLFPSLADERVVHLEVARGDRDDFAV